MHALESSSFCYVNSACSILFFLQIKRCDVDDIGRDFVTYPPRIVLRIIPPESDSVIPPRLNVFLTLQGVKQPVHRLRLLSPPALCSKKPTAGTSTNASSLDQVNVGNDQAGNDQAGNDQVGNDQVGNDLVGNDQVGNDLRVEETDQAEGIIVYMKD